MTHPIDSVEFLIDSGIGETIYKNGQNAVKLVKCIKAELAELAG